MCIKQPSCCRRKRVVRAHELSAREIHRRLSAGINRHTIKHWVHDRRQAAVVLLRHHALAAHLPTVSQCSSQFTVCHTACIRPLTASAGLAVAISDDLRTVGLPQQFYTVTIRIGSGRETIHDVVRTATVAPSVDDACGSGDSADAAREQAVADGGVR